MRTVNEMTHFESLNSIFITYFQKHAHRIFSFFLAPLNATLILFLVEMNTPYFLCESEKNRLGALFNLKSRKHVNIHGIKAAIKKTNENKQKNVHEREEAHSHIMQYQQPTNKVVSSAYEEKREKI